mmetsp:Transcript_10748/g.10875  ORF Transcript_10748/g.10875 Transcript_10748/m.10875 type:complete len:103 (+) Transcript_10748:25-333(+)
MSSSCDKRWSEGFDLEKIKTDNKIRVAVNLHNHVNSTWEISSSIRHLVKDLKSLKKGANTAKLINEIDRCAQIFIIPGKNVFVANIINTIKVLLLVATFFKH